MLFNGTQLVGNFNYSAKNAAGQILFARTQDAVFNREHELLLARDRSGNPIGIWGDDGKAGTEVTSDKSVMAQSDTARPGYSARAIRAFIVDAGTLDEKTVYFDSENRITMILDVTWELAINQLSGDEAADSVDALYRALTEPNAFVRRERVSFFWDAEKSYEERSAGKKLNVATVNGKFHSFIDGAIDSSKRLYVVEGATTPQGDRTFVVRYSNAPMAIGTVDKSDELDRNAVLAWGKLMGFDLDGFGNEPVTQILIGGDGKYVGSTSLNVTEVEVDSVRINVLEALSQARSKALESENPSPQSVHSMFMIDAKGETVSFAWTNETANDPGEVTYTTYTMDLFQSDELSRDPATGDIPTRTWQKTGYLGSKTVTTYFGTGAERRSFSYTTRIDFTTEKAFRGSEVFSKAFTTGYDTYSEARSAVKNGSLRWASVSYNASGFNLPDGSVTGMVQVSGGFNGEGNKTFSWSFFAFVNGMTYDKKISSQNESYKQAWDGYHNISELLLRGVNYGASLGFDSYEGFVNLLSSKILSGSSYGMLAIISNATTATGREALETQIKDILSSLAPTTAARTGSFQEWQYDKRQENARIREELRDRGMRGLIGPDERDEYSQYQYLADVENAKQYDKRVEAYRGYLHISFSFQEEINVMGKAVLATRRDSFGYQQTTGSYSFSWGGKDLVVTFDRSDTTARSLLMPTYTSEDNTIKMNGAYQILRSFGLSFSEDDGLTGAGRILSVGAVDSATGRIDDPIVLNSNWTFTLKTETITRKVNDQASRLGTPGMRDLATAMSSSSYTVTEKRHSIMVDVILNQGETVNGQSREQRINLKYSGSNLDSVADHFSTGSLSDLTIEGVRFDSGRITAGDRKSFEIVTNGSRFQLEGSIGGKFQKNIFDTAGFEPITGNDGRITYGVYGVKILSSEKQDATGIQEITYTYTERRTEKIETLMTDGTTQVVQNQRFGVWGAMSVGQIVWSGVAAVGVVVAAVAVTYFTGGLGGYAAATGAGATLAALFGIGTHIAVYSGIGFGLCAFGSYAANGFAASSYTDAFLVYTAVSFAAAGVFALPAAFVAGSSGVLTLNGILAGLGTAGFNFQLSRTALTLAGPSLDGSDSWMKPLMWLGTYGGYLAYAGMAAGAWQFVSEMGKGVGRALLKTGSAMFANRATAIAVVSVVGIGLTCVVVSYIPAVRHTTWAKPLRVVGIVVIVAGLIVVPSIANAVTVLRAAGVAQAGSEAARLATKVTVRELMGQGLMSAGKVVYLAALVGTGAFAAGSVIYALASGQKDPIWKMMSVRIFLGVLVAGKILPFMCGNLTVLGKLSTAFKPLYFAGMVMSWTGVGLVIYGNLNDQKELVRIGVALVIAGFVLRAAAGYMNAKFATDLAKVKAGILLDGGNDIATQFAGRLIQQGYAADALLLAGKTSSEIFWKNAMGSILWFRMFPTVSAALWMDHGLDFITRAKGDARHTKGLGWFDHLVSVIKANFALSDKQGGLFDRDRMVHDIFLGKVMGLFGVSYGGRAGEAFGHGGFFRGIANMISPEKAGLIFGKAGASSTFGAMVLNKIDHLILFNMVVQPIQRLPSLSGKAQPGGKEGDHAQQQDYVTQTLGIPRMILSFLLMPASMLETSWSGEGDKLAAELASYAIFLVPKQATNLGDLFIREAAQLNAQKMLNDTATEQAAIKLAPGETLNSLFTAAKQALEKGEYGKALRCVLAARQLAADGLTPGLNALEAAIRTEAAKKYASGEWNAKENGKATWFMTYEQMYAKALSEMVLTVFVALELGAGRTANAETFFNLTSVSIFSKQGAEKFKNDLIRAIETYNVTAIRELSRHLLNDSALRPLLENFVQAVNNRDAAIKAASQKLGDQKLQDASKSAAEQLVTAKSAVLAALTAVDFKVDAHILVMERVGTLTYDEFQGLIRDGVAAYRGKDLATALAKIDQAIAAAGDKESALGQRLSLIRKAMTLPTDFNVTATAKALLTAWEKSGILSQAVGREFSNLPRTAEGLLGLVTSGRGIPIEFLTSVVYVIAGQEARSFIAAELLQQFSLRKDKAALQFLFNSLDKSAEGLNFGMWAKQNGVKLSGALGQMLIAGSLRNAIAGHLIAAYGGVKGFNRAVYRGALDTEKATVTFKNGVILTQNVLNVISELTNGMVRNWDAVVGLHLFNQFRSDTFKAFFTGALPVWLNVAEGEKITWRLFVIIALLPANGTLLQVMARWAGKSNALEQTATAKAYGKAFELLTRYLVSVAQGAEVVKDARGNSLDGRAFRASLVDTLNSVFGIELNVLAENLNSGRWRFEMTSAKVNLLAIDHIQKDATGKLEPIDNPELLKAVRTLRAKLVEVAKDALRNHQQVPAAQKAFLEKLKATSLADIQKNGEARLIDVKNGQEVKLFGMRLTDAGLKNESQYVLHRVVMILSAQAKMVDGFLTDAGTAKDIAGLRTIAERAFPGVKFTDNDLQVILKGAEAGRFIFEGQKGEQGRIERIAAFLWTRYSEGKGLSTGAAIKDALMADFQALTALKIQIEADANAKFTDPVLGGLLKLMAPMILQGRIEAAFQLWESHYINRAIGDQAFRAEAKKVLEANLKGTDAQHITAILGKVVQEFNSWTQNRATNKANPVVFFEKLTEIFSQYSLSKVNAEQALSALRMTFLANSGMDANGFLAMVRHIVAKQAMTGGAKNAAEFKTLYFQLFSKEGFKIYDPRLMLTEVQMKQGWDLLLIQNAMGKLSDGKGWWFLAPQREAYQAMKNTMDRNAEALNLAMGGGKSALAIMLTAVTGNVNLILVSNRALAEQYYKDANYTKLLEAVSGKQFVNGDLYAENAGKDPTTLRAFIRILSDKRTYVVVASREAVAQLQNSIMSSENGEIRSLLVPFLKAFQSSTRLFDEVHQCANPMYFIVGGTVRSAEDALRNFKVLDETAKIMDKLLFFDLDHNQGRVFDAARQIRVTSSEETFNKLVGDGKKGVMAVLVNERREIIKISNIDKIRDFILGQESVAQAAKAIGGKPTELLFTSEVRSILKAAVFDARDPGSIISFMLGRNGVQLYGGQYHPVDSFGTIQINQIIEDTAWLISVARTLSRAHKYAETKMAEFAKLTNSGTQGTADQVAQFNLYRLQVEEIRPHLKTDVQNISLTSTVTAVSMFDLFVTTAGAARPTGMSGTALGVVTPLSVMMGRMIHAVRDANYETGGFLIEMLTPFHKFFGTDHAKNPAHTFSVQELAKTKSESARYQLMADIIISYMMGVRFGTAAGDLAIRFGKGSPVIAGFESTFQIRQVEIFLRDAVQKWNAANPTRQFELVNGKNFFVVDGRTEDSQIKGIRKGFEKAANEGPAVLLSTQKALTGVDYQVSKATMLLFDGTLSEAQAAQSLWRVGRTIFGGSGQRYESHMVSFVDRAQTDQLFNMFQGDAGLKRLGAWQTYFAGQLKGSAAAGLRYFTNADGSEISLKKTATCGQEVNPVTLLSKVRTPGALSLQETWLLSTWITTAREKDATAQSLLQQFWTFRLLIDPVRGAYQEAVRLGNVADIALIRAFGEHLHRHWQGEAGMESASQFSQGKDLVRGITAGRVKTATDEFSKFLNDPNSGKRLSQSVQARLQAGLDFCQVLSKELMGYRGINPNDPLYQKYFQGSLGEITDSVVRARVMISIAMRFAGDILPQDTRWTAPLEGYTGQTARVATVQLSAQATQSLMAKGSNGQLLGRHVGVANPTAVPVHWGEGTTQVYGTLNGMQGSGLQLDLSPLLADPNARGLLAMPYLNFQWTESGLLQISADINMMMQQGGSAAQFSADIFSSQYGLPEGLRDGAKFHTALNVQNLIDTGRLTATDVSSLMRLAGNVDSYQSFMQEFRTLGSGEQKHDLLVRTFGSGLSSEAMHYLSGMDETQITHLTHLTDYRAVQQSAIAWTARVLGRSASDLAGLNLWTFWTALRQYDTGVSHLNLSSDKARPDDAALKIALAAAVVASESINDPNFNRIRTDIARKELGLPDTVAVPLQGVPQIWQDLLRTVAVRALVTGQFTAMAAQVQDLTEGPGALLSRPDVAGQEIEIIRLRVSQNKDGAAIVQALELQAAIKAHEPTVEIQSLEQIMELVDRGYGTWDLFQGMFSTFQGVRGIMDVTSVKQFLDVVGALDLKPDQKGVDLAALMKSRMLTEKDGVLEFHDSADRVRAKLKGVGIESARVRYLQGVWKVEVPDIHGRMIWLEITEGRVVYEISNQDPIYRIISLRAVREGGTVTFEGVSGNQPETFAELNLLRDYEAVTLEIDKIAGSVAPEIRVFGDSPISEAGAFSALVSLDGSLESPLTWDIAGAGRRDLAGKLRIGGKAVMVELPGQLHLEVRLPRGVRQAYRQDGTIELRIASQFDPAIEQILVVQKFDDGPELPDEERYRYQVVEGQQFAYALSQMANYTEQTDETASGRAAEDVRRLNHGGEIQRLMQEVLLFLPPQEHEGFLVWWEQNKSSVAEENILLRIREAGFVAKMHAQGAAGFEKLAEAFHRRTDPEARRKIDSTEDVTHPVAVATQLPQMHDPVTRSLMDAVWDAMGVHGPRPLRSKMRQFMEWTPDVLIQRLLERNPAVQQAYAAWLKERKKQAVDPWNSEPSLKEKLAAIKGLVGRSSQGNLVGRALGFWGSRLREAVAGDLARLEMRLTLQDEMGKHEAEILESWKKAWAQNHNGNTPDDSEVNKMREQLRFLTGKADFWDLFQYQRLQRMSHREHNPVVAHMQDAKKHPSWARHHCKRAAEFLVDGGSRVPGHRGVEKRDRELAIKQMTELLLAGLRDGTHDAVIFDYQRGSEAVDLPDAKEAYIARLMLQTPALSYVDARAQAEKDWELKDSEGRVIRVRENRRWRLEHGYLDDPIPSLTLRGDASRKLGVYWRFIGGNWAAESGAETFISHDFSKSKRTATRIFEMTGLFVVHEAWKAQSYLHEENHLLFPRPEIGRSNTDPANEEIMTFLAQGAARIYDHEESEIYNWTIIKKKLLSYGSSSRNLDAAALDIAADAVIFLMQHLDRKTVMDVIRNSRTVHDLLHWHDYSPEELKAIFATAEDFSEATREDRKAKLIALLNDRAADKNRLEVALETIRQSMSEADYARFAVELVVEITPAQDARQGDWYLVLARLLEGGHDAVAKRGALAREAAKVLRAAAMADQALRKYLSDHFSIRFLVSESELLDPKKMKGVDAKAGEALLTGVQGVLTAGRAEKQSPWIATRPLFDTVLSETATKDLDALAAAENWADYESTLMLALKGVLEAAIGPEAAQQELFKLRFAVRRVEHKEMDAMLRLLNSTDVAEKRRAVDGILANLDDSLDNLISKYGLDAEALMHATFKPMADGVGGNILLDPAHLPSEFMIKDGESGASEPFGRPQQYLRYTFMLKDHGEHTAIHEEGHDLDNINAFDYDGRIYGFRDQNDFVAKKAALIGAELHSFLREIYVSPEWRALAATDEAGKRVLIRRYIAKIQSEYLPGYLDKVARNLQDPLYPEWAVTPAQAAEIKANLKKWATRVFKIAEDMLLSSPDIDTFSQKYLEQFRSEYAPIRTKPVVGLDGFDYKDLMASDKATMQAVQAISDEVGKAGDLTDVPLEANLRVVQADASTRLSFVLKTGGEIVGFVIASPDRHEGAFLMNFGITQKHQKGGKGAAMMHELALRAMRAGLKVIRLGVETSNAGAIRLYERLGFKPEGSDYARDGRTFRTYEADVDTLLKNSVQVRSELRGPAVGYAAVTSDQVLGRAVAQADRLGLVSAPPVPIDLRTSVEGAVNYDELLRDKKGYFNETQGKIVLNSKKLEETLESIQALDIPAGERQAMMDQVVNDLAVALVHERVHVAGGNEFMAYEATVEAMKALDAARYAWQIEVILALLAMARGNMLIEDPAMKDALRAAALQVLEGHKGTRVFDELLISNLSGKVIVYKDADFAGKVGTEPVSDVSALDVERLKALNPQHTAIAVRMADLADDGLLARLNEYAKQGFSISVYEKGSVEEGAFVRLLAALTPELLKQLVQGDIPVYENSIFFDAGKASTVVLIKALIGEVLAQQSVSVAA